MGNEELAEQALELCTEQVGHLKEDIPQCKRNTSCWREACRLS